ncbi:LysR family transcriptional regulator [Parasphingorhabdus cellanae]|uniref:LysR family transcriptional regulator n=1 Tax=Parasphingorhabdus cellanae TaxID=2806553 RepID=A0ABX7T6D3_9SPHN|nr:LysR family transcriptional regulator [Parasphingorhabdus cellanae]QTD57169.1 LysR family transcriptional regulator [Parasphingorhabdus cellanae]
MTIDWDTVRCFIEVAEKRSLMAAANTLGMSNATLGRKIDALEVATGLQLILRGPGGVALTDQGKEVLALAKAGGDHLFQMERLAFSLKSDRRALPIRISTTETMVSAVLAPHLSLLWDKHPGLVVDLIMSTELADLNRREADIAVRLARPKSEGLITRKLPEITAGLYASTGYLNGRDPGSLDLRHEKLAGLDDQFGDIPESVWIRQHELQQALSVQSSSIYALMEVAKSGAAIAMVPDFLAQRHGLFRVSAPPIPVRKPWIVFHRDNRRNREIRAVRDWIVACCQNSFTLS